MASPDEPQSLRAVFDEAEARRKALETAADTRSPSYCAEVEATLELYGRALEQMDAVGLFSTNEGIDDVATSALPYLLASFHVACVVAERTTAPSTTDRAQMQLERRRTLQRARVAYERFLDLVDAYGLVVSPYDKLLERYRDGPTVFAVAPPTADAAARRHVKIAGFRKAKALADEVACLAADASVADDDEVVRRVHLARVAEAVHATFHALDGLNRELALLALAEEPSREHMTVDDPTARLDAPLGGLARHRGGPLLSRAGRPLQPFTLVGSRTDVARAVFGPGHNLPTMSIDEYLAEERRRGNILQGGSENAPPPADLDDDPDAADRETYKARAWDDFKDDNPRGSGNTLNMG